MNKIVMEGTNGWCLEPPKQSRKGDVNFTDRLLNNTDTAIRLHGNIFPAIKSFIDNTLSVPDPVTGLPSINSLINQVITERQSNLKIENGLFNKTVNEALIRLGNIDFCLLNMQVENLDTMQSPFIFLQPLIHIQSIFM